MFNLTNTDAKLANLNPRAEKHGEENALACDIKLEIECHSTVLDHFDKSLRKLLYRKPALGEQEGLPFAGDDQLTALRLPSLANLKWVEDFPGYTLTFSAGLGASDLQVIDDVELSNFTFEAVEGGSVLVTVRATCHPTPDQIGILSTLIQETVQITLEPPSRGGRGTGGAQDTMD